MRAILSSLLGGEHIRRGYFRVWLMLASIWAAYFALTSWPREALTSLRFSCGVHETFDVRSQMGFHYSSCMSAAEQSQEIATDLSQRYVDRTFLDPPKARPTADGVQIAIEADRRGRIDGSLNAIFEFFVILTGGTLLIYPAGAALIAAGNWLVRGFSQ